MPDSAVAPNQSTAITSPTAVALRPPLKWAGGKRWQVSHLHELWDAHRHRRLVEPFCGGMAVTLGLMPQAALLNDVSPHVINVYRWLKRGLTITLPMTNDATTYYAYRVRFNDLLQSGQGESADAAALFLYLNRTGYNGLCRFNSKGGFNVPFGRYKKIGYRTDFLEYQKLFARFEFTNTDFENLTLHPDDFVYADPPYDVEFTQYSKGGFDWSAQQRAAEWLATHPGPVVLSNQWTDRIVKLYQELGYTIVPLTAPRLISCTGDRTPAKEVLATRNL
jgi:DNA adenine methylase